MPDALSKTRDFGWNFVGVTVLSHGAHDVARIRDNHSESWPSSLVPLVNSPKNRDTPSRIRVEETVNQP